MSAHPSAPAGRFASVDEWLGWLETLHPKKIDFGLERVQCVLARLSLSKPAFRVVTVAGTNGKGSCVALLESIYAAAGYRVGAFTSPHLWRFNERIRFAAEDVGDAALLEAFARIDAARREVSLSYFEWSTVAALLVFAQREAEVAILEVGMGGRLDSTNAIDADVAVIVSVDLDHQQWLGADRDAIGREKAGIARAARPAIVGERRPPAGLVGELERRGAVIQLIGRDFDGTPAGTGWHYRGPGGARVLPLPRFGADEQLANVAAVTAAVDALSAPLPVTADALARGIQAAGIRGRQERWRRGGVEWVFDVAHNRAAAAALVRALVRWPSARRTVAVVGIMADKDIAGVLEPFVPHVDEWWLASIESERGASAAVLADTLGALGAARTRVCERVAQACGAASAAVVDGERVLVFGSFYTVGPAMTALGLYSAPSQPSDRSATWMRI